MQNGNKKWIIILVVIGAAVVAAIMLFGNKTPLPGFTGQQDIGKPAEPETEPEPQTSMFTYSDDTIGFSIQIPQGWQQVLKNGFVTFIHSGSASSIQLETGEYTPSVTTVDQTVLSANLAAENCSLMNFYWVDNSSYMTLYQSQGERPVDHIEYVTFDRDTIVKLHYTVYDEYYPRMEKELGTSMDSFQWNKKNPVPSYFTLYYSENGNFEFGVPIGWDTGIVDGAFYAESKETGAAYTITVTESNASYDTVSQIDYVGFASQGRPNFLLKTFASDGKVITATASYIVNGVNMMLKQYLVSTGTYEYSITEECPTQTYDTVADLFDQAIHVFRIFDATETENTEPKT